MCDEIIEKISKNLSRVIKKQSPMSNIYLVGNVLLAASIICATNFFLNIGLNCKINKLMNHNARLENNIHEIKKDNSKKTEAILSLLNLYDNLFNDVIISTNKIAIIQDNIREISEKIDVYNNDFENCDISISTPKQIDTNLLPTSPTNMSETYDILSL